MVNKIAFLLVMLFFGIAGCSKDSGAMGKHTGKMEIPQGFPGGPSGDPQITSSPNLQK
jgi:hypothetical protein